MKINAMFPADLGARDQYKMTKSPEVQKMTEAAGSVLEVAAWINYEVMDESTGESKEIIAIMTAEGEMFATISKIFIKGFKDIVEIFGDNVGLIKVVSNTSRAGRNYITCTIE